MAKKVVIIDDRINELNKIKNAFNDFDWETYCIKSISEVFDLIYDVSIDLIITKTTFAKIGAYQFLKILREDKLLSKIPIILCYENKQININFYLKRKNLEFSFFKEKENYKELVGLAEFIIKNNPISKQDKIKILASNIDYDLLTNKKEIKIEDKKNKQTSKEYFNKIYKKNFNNKTRNKKDGYFLNKIDLKYFEKFSDFSSQNVYFGILSILNYQRLEEDLQTEELDFLSSKISQKIVALIDDIEQVYKNEEDEYNIIIFAKNNQEAKKRFELMVKTLNILEYNDIKLELALAASCSKINGKFNIYQAKTIARQLIEKISENLEEDLQNERVVVK